MVDLSKFDQTSGLDRGRPRLVEILWYITKMVFFLSAFPWPSSLKRFLLVSFGAKIGKDVIVKPRVNIHFPWKLIIGNNSWIGEEVFILNFEPIEIGSNVCISQRAFLCGGNHDFRDPTFKYRNGSITIKDEAWVGAQSFIAPNVVINQGVVITAGSIVYSNLSKNMICSGNPCVELKGRYV